jgi:hypothetical protein
VTGRRSILRRPTRLLQLLMTAAGLTFSRQVHCQEALRLSIAGDTAAEIQRQQQNSIGYYNLLWGPVALRFASGLALDYDDNVHLQSHGAEGDLITRPNVNVQSHWPMTQENSLDAALGAGYSFYATHSDLNQLYVNPGSGLSFNIYVGDCVINLHDRISITENAYQNPTAGGNGSYSQLENTVGLSTYWDLNKLVAQAGYDHVNDVSLGSNDQVPDSSSDNWYLNVGVRLLPEITAGVEGGFGLISYSQNQSNEPNASQWNAGVFCRAQVSENFSGRLDAGYTVYAPENSGSFTNAANTENLYFQVTLSHRVNRFLNYSLSAGRSTDSSYYGQAYDYYFVRLQSNWSILKNYQLSTSFWWQKGNELYALGGASDFDQYGAGVNLSRSLTKKLTGGLGYQYVRETSAQSNLNYTVNIISLSFSYQF